MNTSSNTTAAAEPSAERSAQRVVIDRLDAYLWAAGPGANESLGDAEALLNDAHAVFWEARDAELRGDDVAALQLLHKLSSKLDLAAEACDIYCPGWALVNASADILRDYLQPDRARRNLALEATGFIARLAVYFQVATVPGTMGDLRAMEQAACALLTYFADDPLDTMEGQMREAWESASVILENQLPPSSHEIDDTRVWLKSQFHELAGAFVNSQRPQTGAGGRPQ